MLSGHRPVLPTLESTSGPQSSPQFSGLEASRTQRDCGGSHAKDSDSLWTWARRSGPHAPDQDPCAWLCPRRLVSGRGLQEWLVRTRVRTEHSRTPLLSWDLQTEMGVLLGSRAHRPPAERTRVKPGRLPDSAQQPSSASLKGSAEHAKLWPWVCPPIKKDPQAYDVVWHVAVLKSSSVRVDQQRPGGGRVCYRSVSRDCVGSGDSRQPKGDRELSEEGRRGAGLQCEGRKSPQGSDVHLGPCPEVLQPRGPGSCTILWACPPQSWAVIGLSAPSQGENVDEVLQLVLITGVSQLKLGNTFSAQGVTMNGKISCICQGGCPHVGKTT